MKKKLFTKLILSIFAYLFIISNTLYSQNILPQEAPLNKYFVEYIQTSNVTKDGFGLGEIPSAEKPNFSYIIKNGAKYAPKTLGFPESYDLRDYDLVTPPKNQGSCGACWTFATMGSIESYWKKNGYGTYDLSENNLKNCHGFTSAPCDGGNHFKSMAYLSRLKGPVYDSLDVYSTTVHDCNPDIEPAAFVMEARFLINTPEILKQALLDYGGLYTNMRWEDSSYNSVDKTYFYGGATSNSTNHAVLLVGWDDTKITAGGVGAWIIKNSWGTYWGESGYFYISYNDTKVNTSVAYFPTKMDYNPEIKQYFYDNFGWTGSFGYNDTIAYGLTKFTAEGNEKVDKVGTWINSAGANITIDVLDSTTGILATVSAFCDYPGYHVINLPSSVNISTGNNFYIRVKYVTPTYNYPLTTESASGCTPVIQTEKCWISYNSSSWTAIGGGTAYARNLCIRAYTSPQEILTCSVDAGADQTICAGDIKSLSATGATSYLWNTGAITAKISVNPVTTTTYYVTGTTGACTIQDTVIVTVNELPIISSFNTTGRVTCNGSFDGFGSVIMLGNNKDYMYVWSNGSTEDSIYDLSGGDYIVTAIGINGCYTKDTMSLFEPAYFPEVSNITEVNNTNKSIVLNWNRNIETTSYMARMKKTTESTWTRYFTINSSDTSILINSLEANTEYVFQIRQFKDSSTYSCMTDYIFTTQEEITNTCNIATSLIVNNVSTSTAKLNWINDINAVSYMVRWRVKAGPEAWRYYTATAGQSSIVIGDLTSDTEYEWQIRKFCVGGFYSDFTNLVGSEFTTNNVALCTQAEYLNVSNLKSTQVTFNWVPVSNDSIYMIRWRVKAGPDAWSYYNAPSGIRIATINGLTSNTEYEWQIRTICNNNSISDFTNLFKFTTSQSCADISSLSQEVGITYAILKWDTVPKADHYLLRWRIQNGAWMYININEQSSEQQIGCAVCNEADQLLPISTYEWQIRAFCNVEGTEYSNFSGIQQFYTLKPKSIQQNVTSKTSISSNFNVYPNPFNENFSIEYNIPQNGNVTIELFDLKGQKISTIANKYETEGNHTITNSLSNNDNSNIYFVRFIFNNEVVIKKIVQIK
ncbi:MAG: hypothetical protein A2X12_10305 [Bacteroidetes bacterium GWE2_29_8]|nr:MAG: hypothetical protein A2X12_10305 [Bacteroidetes bacterium GWE2_29_8]OFY17405.1 MAG: hypothetical protein A2X02_00725 [Bacteroidetes bacterium GWF2_29_10]